MMKNYKLRKAGYSWKILKVLSYDVEQMNCEFSEMSTLITLLSWLIVFRGCQVLLQNCNEKEFKISSLVVYPFFARCDKFKIYFSRIIMNRTKNHYIKYTRNELENYTKHPQTCIKKIKCVEPIRFSPTIISDFQSSILRILSRKIGKYDNRLDGIVLDFRNTRILNTQSGIRQDSAFSTIHVETNFYVFSPQPGANVWGTVKYINRMSMETIISVVIYRVFNVKVAVKGKVKHEFEKDQEIQIRVKNFHFENVIPYIEGALIHILPTS